jgi:YfiH family protein
MELAAATGVRHGFFGRRGGVSEDLFSSLNCGYGSGDAEASVRENRQRATHDLAPAADLVTSYQVHSTEAVVVTRPWERGGAPRADALVTRAPGIALGILSADCAPVLFADPVARVVGAAHAGWRGALAGVVESTVETMVGQGARADRIVAAVGPAIGRASYEVGPEFPELFHSPAIPTEDLFDPAEREGHFTFDLPAYVERRLASCGLASIETLDVDTYAQSEQFFSFRRATHRGESRYGRALSAIVIEF